MVIHGNLKQNRDNKILHLNYNPGQAILHRCKLARLYSKQGKYSLHDVNLHCRVLFYPILEVYTKFEIVLERIILAPLKHWTFYAFKPFCCPNILLVDFIVLFSYFFIWHIFHQDIARHLSHNILILSSSGKCPKHCSTKRSSLVAFTDINFSFQYISIDLHH